jgi:hypothetical protein
LARYLARELRDNPHIFQPIKIGEGLNPDIAIANAGNPPDRQSCRKDTAMTGCHDTVPDFELSILRQKRELG